jgi:DNA repair exonuclease SbcCD ATPase subunit
MKTIKITSIRLTNFKGIKNQLIEFDNNTDIFGANGTGKTTIYDAFLWLLFGKNSEDKKDFNIKNTVDLSLNRQEHEVQAVMIIDGETNTLKRIYKEKWQKKRGEEVSEMTGNETLYYLNEVPMQQKEFQSKVSSFLEESVFKLVTNPYAFHSLKWQDRRSVLLQMAGEITDEELAKGVPEYEALVANLTQGKTMEDYRKQIIASVKKKKDDLKAIPTRVDEVLKSMPDALDFVALKSDLAVKEKEVLAVDNQIQNKSAAFDEKLKAINEKKLQANTLRSEIQTIQANIKVAAENSLKPDTSEIDGLNSKLATKKGELQSANNALETLEGKKTSFENTISALDSMMGAKRNEWKIENSKGLTFEDQSFCCPTCKRDFEASDVEDKKKEMLANFTQNKQIKLNEINAKGKALAEEKTATEKELSVIVSRIATGNEMVTGLETEIKEIESAIEIVKAKSFTKSDLTVDQVITNMLLENVDYNRKSIELENLVATIEEVPVVDVEDLKTQRRSIQIEIDEIKSKILLETQIASCNKRLEQLKSEEKSLAQQIADVEKTQFTIERFEKLKMTALEEKVNSMFKMVKFRMFDTQVNGGESPDCEIMVNGVPFSDANTASKINAGIDIISTLCNYYQVSAPIFIDGAESIHDIIGTESQLIRLVVSKEDKALRVA